MSINKLLQAWPRVQRSALAWRIRMEESDAPDRLARAVGAALAEDRNPAEVVQALLEEGEFEAAELLMLEAQLDDEGLIQARRGAKEALAPRLEALKRRAALVKVALDAQEILELLDGNRRTAEARLKRAEQEVVQAEDALTQAIRHQLGASSSEDDTREPWQESVERALQQGDLAAARTRLEAGPTGDLSTLSLPAAPRWLWRGRPLPEILGWFFGEGLQPPGFARYQPESDDQAARDFLAAVRLHLQAPSEATRNQLAHAVAPVLGCRVLNHHSSPEAAFVVLDDLSTPGLPALGRLRWPQGIALAVTAEDREPTSLPEDLPKDLLIRWATHEVGPASGALVLQLPPILAVLSDRAHRRERLLLTLGRQFPLAQAFDEARPDESIRWERREWPQFSAEEPNLLVGAPGMGKSTLLREMALYAGSLVKASTEELPEADLLYIDEIDRLDPPALRALVREVHWVVTTRDPAPRVVLAVRPATRPLIESLCSRGFRFQTHVLPPRSLQVLRDQASTLLGYLGVQAAQPGAHDHIALLASGNPTLLFHLCGALVSLLKDRHEKFTTEHVEAAWRAERMDRVSRSLFWEPLKGNASAVQVLRFIADYGQPYLSRDDLSWLIGQQPDFSGPLEAHLTLLLDYGLIQQGDPGLRLCPGGLTERVHAWLRASESPAEAAL